MNVAQIDLTIPLRTMATLLSQQLLLIWTDKAASEADRRHAARLYLHGAGLQWFKISESTFNNACLVAGITPRTRTVRSVKKPKIAPDAETCRLALEAFDAAINCEPLEDEVLMCSMENFFKSIGWMTPADLAFLIETQGPAA